MMHHLHNRDSVYLAIGALALSMWILILAPLFKLKREVRDLRTRQEGLMYTLRLLSILRKTDKVNHHTLEETWTGAMDEETRPGLERVKPERCPVYRRECHLASAITLAEIDYMLTHRENHAALRPHPRSAESK